MDLMHYRIIIIAINPVEDFQTLALILINIRMNLFGKYYRKFLSHHISILSLSNKFTTK